MKHALARWIATVSWIGLSPFAPGTLASVCAAVIFFILRLLGFGSNVLCSADYCSRRTRVVGERCDGSPVWAKKIPLGW